jgi:mono/diheme cytochrome c family protein/rhodanese-related sulfurtransferase
VREGRALYQRYCSLCHGKNAEGYAADHANALGNADFLAITSDEQLRGAIAEGRPGTPMSAWGARAHGPLDDKQIDRIVAYLRSLARKRFVKLEAKANTGDPSRGRVAFANSCAVCHGARGEGSPRATSLTHPNFLDSVSDGYLRHVIVNGRRGTQMAGYGSLPRETIEDLIAYVRSSAAVPGPALPQAYEPPPGLDQLVINPASTPPKFTLREGRFVPAADVAKALEEKRKIVILDARPTSDWNRAHIVGALPFPFYDVELLAKTLPKDGTWIVAYCACPHAASGHVVDELRKRGFANTAVLDEGIGFWNTKGYPTAQGKLLSKASP